jgi:hypothetical protein
MSKIVRVQGGDYKIVVGAKNSPGTIVLDTNPNDDRLSPQGEVIITGDLTVLGKSTIVQSETLAIKDNIIYVNAGEQGSGVSTLGTSAGLQIDRGNLPDVSILWNEEVASWSPALGTVLLGTFTFVNADGTLSAIATNSISTNGGDLNLIGSGTGKLTVNGTLNYENQVLNYIKLKTVIQVSSVSRTSGITTVTTVEPHDLFIGARFVIRIVDNSSFNAGLISALTIIDYYTFTYANPGDDVATIPVIGTVKPDALLADDIIPNMKAVADYVSNTSYIIPNRIVEDNTSVQVFDVNVSGKTEIAFVVNGAQRASLSDNGFTNDNIKIQNNSISNYANDNLLIDSILSLENRLADPATISGYISLYSKAEPGGGGTGLYFVNTKGIRDELISKRKSIVYSLIF